MKNSLVFLSVLTLCVACSKVQQAEKTMESMKKNTTAVSETSADMHEQMRSKESEDTRDEKFDILIPEGGFGKRLAAAAVLYKSFEFQLWTSNGSYDDKHARDVLLLDAVNEFTRKICDLYAEINPRKMSPTKTKEKFANEQSFYALAAAMHMTHHYQDQLVEQKAGLKKISFYDIVKSSLKKEFLSEPMADYENVLVTGDNKEIMIELVKARVDMLAALALKNLTDKRKMNVIQKTKAAVYKVSLSHFGEIELPETYLSANTATKEQIETYLDAATKARNFLKQIGVEKKLEKTLSSAFSNVKLGQMEGQNLDQSSFKSSTVDRNIRMYIDGLLQ